MAKKRRRQKPGRKAGKYGKYEQKLRIPIPFQEAVRGLISVKVPPKKSANKK